MSISNFFEAAAARIFLSYSSKKKIQGKVSCDLAKLIFMATSAQHISTSLLEPRELLSLFFSRQEEWVVIIGHRAGWATVYRPCTLGLGFKLGFELGLRVRVGIRVLG